MGVDSPSSALRPLLLLALALVGFGCRQLPSENSEIESWFDEHRLGLETMVRIGETHPHLQYPLNQASDASPEGEVLGQIQELARDLQLDHIAYLRTADELEEVHFGYFRGDGLKKTIIFTRVTESLDKPPEEALFLYKPLGNTEQGDPGWYLSTPRFSN